MEGCLKSDKGCLKSKKAENNHFDTGPIPEVNH